MKRIITFLLLFAALKVAGQTTGYLRFDTVRIMKQNGTCELYLINKTKDTIGFLYNVGGGLTQFRRIRQLTDTSFVAGVDTIRIVGTGGGGVGSVTSISQGYGITNTPNPIIATGTIRVDTSQIATVTSLRDSLLAHPTLIVDTVVYAHATTEVDTLTFTELIGKTIISAEVHPYNLHLATSYPPATEDIWTNNATGGVKFGTAIQNGQTVTFIYKYLVTSGSPVVESIQVNSDPPQTGTVVISVPEQFNPIAGTNMSITGSYPNMTFNASLPGGGATLSQVDSAIIRSNGKANVKNMHLILRPTWSGSATTWDILGHADAHDTLYTGGLTVSTVGGQLRINYPSGDYMTGLQANWDDVLQKNLYAIGGSAGLTFTQFTIWKNFHGKAVWLGSDLLDGSYDNSAGNIYRVKCDTSTGLFTAEWNLNTADTLYTTLVEAGNYFDNFPQAHIIQVRRSTTQSMEFYLVDALTGLRRKGLLTTNDNFFISVHGRQAVNADTENFGANAAIFIDGALIDNP